MLKQSVFAKVMLILFMAINVFPLQMADGKTNIVDIHFVREYVDGEQSTEIVRKKVDSMAELLQEYPDWELIESDETKITLYKKIHDLSPLLKVNGYFGLSENDILTLYEGKPEDENVIQSFYQLDIEKLETHLLNQLKYGIPIKSKADYVTVIKQLKQYEKRKPE